MIAVATSTQGKNGKEGKMLRWRLSRLGLLMLLSRQHPILARLPALLQSADGIIRTMIDEKRERKYARYQI